VCRHDYPATYFTEHHRSYRGGFLCDFCDDKRREIIEDAKRDRYEERYGRDEREDD